MRPQRKEIRVQSFAELSLSAPLSRAITELGYEKPSPIQAEALPLLLGEPTDFLGLAATGTGKTAAFSIPMLEKLDAKKRAVQTLILCPTRELALQVAGQIELLGKYKGVRTLAIYGGSGYAEQFRGLRDGAQVVVGTPGRIIDHLERGSLVLDNIQTVILDEADEMISMGFKEDLETILKSVSMETCRIWLFSATMSPEVRRVADEYLREPKTAQINKTEMLPSTVKQYFYMTRESDKPEILCKLIDAAEEFYGIVFCQTKSLVVDLTQYLMDRGHKVDCLHGDKSQDAREKTMQAFRDRRVNVMVCTDVASRGLDVKDITHVINYSLPRELDNYVHRIGRTGRSGKSGIAMSLVTTSHRQLIFRIERMTKSRMEEGELPSRKDIGAKKIQRVFPKFKAQDNFQRALDVLDDSWKEAVAGMTAEEVAGRFLSLMVPDVFANERPQMPKRDPRPQRDGYAPRGRYNEGQRPQRFGGGDRNERPQRYGDRPERPARFGGPNRDQNRDQARGGDFREERKKPFRPFDGAGQGNEERPRMNEGERPRFNNDGERPRFNEGQRPPRFGGADRKDRPQRFDRGGERPFRKRPPTNQDGFVERKRPAARGHFSARIED